MALPRCAKLKTYGITTPITTVPTGIDRGFFEAADKSSTIRKKYGITPENIVTRIKAVFNGTATMTRLTAVA